jgi:hypothetical protein
MLPMSSRTLRARIADGHIPYIRPSGAKRLLFHWPTVEQALLKDTITGGGSK